MPRWAPSASRRDDAVGGYEAPVTALAYFLCVFSAFGGILFGYDSGYISGVLAMNFFKQEFGRKSLSPRTGKSTANATTGPGWPADNSDTYQGYLYETWQKSLITSILSAGTFFGALFAGSLADWIGRRSTIMAGCAVFAVGVAMQVASTTIALLVPGRLISGIGVGFVSAIIILYMSEVAPKSVRGAIVSGYQFCITIGLLLAAVVDQSTKDEMSIRSYRIPMAIQFVWAFILGTGLFFLPESPRYYVMKDRYDDAVRSLSVLRGQPIDSEYVKQEASELVASYRYELESTQLGWLDCFRGGLSSPHSNLRRVILGTALQMMQQWTGVNFICEYRQPSTSNLPF
jgi:sugar porter (SP) family MFS transporter